MNEKPKNNGWEFKKQIMAANSIKFYIALQGCHPPLEYIQIARNIEELGFDRIYIYDDLMYYPSWPILSLIAEHTEKIGLGPCVVNGFYRHPAIIASNAVFLDNLAKTRLYLGIGRGAFFDYLDMNLSEANTRRGFEETLQLIKRFLDKDVSAFEGKYFNANEKAVLRVDPVRQNIPLVAATWNQEMAYLAGKYCNELQVAGIWNISQMKQLFRQFKTGNRSNQQIDNPNFAIGGMSCISDDRVKAYKTAKQTAAIYFPYLRSALKMNRIKIRSDMFKRIGYYSKRGKYEKAAISISDKAVETLVMVGTPDNIVCRLNHIIRKVKIDGILFSPPFGIKKSLIDNIELISEKVIKKLDVN